MGKKIFVSYKYGDGNVAPINHHYFATPRHYVDHLQSLLVEEDHIYKGENDDEDMGTLADSTISSKLGDKIYNSTITIVLISKEMKEPYKLERDQWIPWEISYSLREQSRNGRTSKCNGVLAVVLPDKNGSYEYFLTYDAECDCTNHNTPILFKILSKNMFNIKESNTSICKNQTVYHGEYSYIPCVKWENFVKDIDHYIDRVCKIRDNKEAYTITKNIP